MKLPHRRQFLHLAAGAAALPAAPRIAVAQSYPTRPVRVIVPVAPAGAADITARLIGQWLSERLGQQFIIDNRPGGGNNIGTEAVVRAPADGYTLLLAATPNAVNVTLYDKLSFNFLRDIAPVATIIRAPTVGEFVPGYEASAWFGIGAPKNTPSQIIDKLNEAINAGLGDPKIRARLADFGGTPLVGSPAEFGKFIAEETEKWAKVIKFAGIKVE